MAYSKKLTLLLFISALVLAVACQKSNSNEQEEVQSSDSLAKTSVPDDEQTETMGIESADLPEALVLKSVKLYTDTTASTVITDISQLSLLSLGKIRTSTLQEVKTLQGQSGFVALSDLAIKDDFMPATTIHSFDRDYILLTVTEGALAPRSEEDEMFDGEQWHLLLYSPYEDILWPVKLMVKDTEPYCFADSEPTMHFFSTTAHPSIESVVAQPHAAEITLRISYADGTFTSFKLQLEEGDERYEMTIVEMINP